MKILIQHTPIDPFAEIKQYQQEMQQDGRFGASAFFIGSMRDHNEGVAVTSMELEYYPEMTQRHLREIAEVAAQRWSLVDVLLMHRVGKITIADPIVLVAVWSEHRADAFEACRFIMEDLKSKAPFWKKELTADGERWVEKNTPGYTN
ncbi:MAG: molybdenum cofactor biosynthesis protein MoaE [Thiotrichales bacterium]|nr:molybdenum cofactor biosynthesis protein MoaE [Thiotrichales bacterium]